VSEIDPTSTLNESKTTNQVTVILPSYQKKNSIIETMSRLHRVGLESNCDFKFRYIIVIDGDDGSSSLIQNLKDPSITVLVNESNEGKGYSLKRGFSQAHSDYVVFFDMDLDIHPAVIIDQIEFLKNNPEFVGIAGSKTHRNSRVVYPYKRKVYSRGFRILVKIMFGENIEDSQTGVKTFRRREVINEIEKSQENGFIFELELMLLLLGQGKKLSYSPVSINHQYDSTISAISVIEILKQLILLKKSLNTLRD
jgi:glycosyltransferase involved in cell wall biosynthesis